MAAPLQVGLAPHHQEAGGVVGVVLDVMGEHLETIDLGGEFRGEHALARRLRAGEIGGGAGTVGGGMAGDLMLAQEARRLRQKHEMRAHRLDLLELAPGHAHQRDPHPHEKLVEDVQPRLGQQAVDVGDPAIGRVFDRQHREIGIAAAHRLDHLLEGGAGHHLHPGPRLTAGLVRIGAQLPLKGDHTGLMRGHAVFLLFRRSLYRAAPQGKRRDARNPRVSRGFHPSHPETSLKRSPQTG